MNVVGFAGYSGSGKTTLIEQLIPLLVGRGLKVSLIKHAHHEFDVDTPGKDSYRHRHAGASEVLVSSAKRWALMHESRDEPEPTLHELLSHLSACDLVIVEGHKVAPIYKIEVYRPSHGKPRLDDLHIRAVVSDVNLDHEPDGRCVIDINQPDLVCDFIINQLQSGALEYMP